VGERLPLRTGAISLAVAPSSRGGRLEHRVQKALAREHLARFVVTTIGGPEKAPTFRWRVDAGLRRRWSTRGSGAGC
jgi:hypothetical protein